MNNDFSEMIIRSPDIIGAVTDRDWKVIKGLLKLNESLILFGMEKQFSMSARGKNMVIRKKLSLVPLFMQ